MFKNVLSPALTIPACADAAGLSPRWLRARIADGSLVLLAVQAGKQNRASLVDAFRTRCVLHLLDSGLRPDQAFWTLEFAVDRLLHIAEPLPLDALRSHLAGVLVHVAPSDGETPDVCRTAAPSEPHGIEAPVVVSLDLSLILADALALLGMNSAAHSSFAVFGGPHGRRRRGPSPLFPSQEFPCPTHNQEHTL